MFKKILSLLLVVIVAFAAYVAVQPNEFRVTRSTVIAADAAAVFNQVNNLNNWNAWSPWAKIDPNAKTTIEGAESGVGSTMKWESENSDVGTGQMTIIENKPNELIKFSLEFTKPFTATNNAEFEFKPDGDKTNVTWSMYGTNNFIGKAMGIIFNCDKMVGTKFEEGFSNLKSVVETK